MSQIITKGLQDLAVTTAKINTSAVTDAKVATGIDAAKLADGSVSNTEFQYINTVTSNVQTQLNGKQATGNYVTALTGDVTATGPGSVAATIAANAVTSSKVRLTNAAPLRARNAANDGDVPIVEVNASDEVLISNGTATAINTTQGTIFDSATSTVSIDYETRKLKNTLGVQSVDWENHALIDSTDNESINWEQRELKSTDGATGLDFSSATDIIIKETISNTARSLSFRNGAGTFSASIKAPALSANYTLTLPVDAGTANQVLKTDGTGVLNWVTPTAGETRAMQTFTLTGTDITNQYIDLSQVAATNSLHVVIDGLAPTLEGASYDYNPSYTGGAGGNTRLAFGTRTATGGVSELIAGDIVQVKYEY